SFCYIVNIIIGNSNFEIRFENAVGRIIILPRHFIILGIFEQLLKLILTQFFDCFIQDFLIHLKTDVGNESALFGTEHISCTPDIQIFHSNIKPGSQVAELYQGFQTLTGFCCKIMSSRSNEITETFLIRTTYTSAQLVQITQSEGLGIINDNRIAIRNVNPRFDNRGGKKNIVFAFNKAHHDLFELLSVHLSMSYRNPGSRNKSLNHPGYLHNVLKAIVYKIDLSASGNFIRYGIAYSFFVKSDMLSEYRLTVWGRCIDNTEVT